MAKEYKRVVMAQGKHPDAYLQDAFENSQEDSEEASD